MSFPLQLQQTNLICPDAFDLILQSSLGKVTGECSTKDACFFMFPGRMAHRPKQLSDTDDECLANLVCGGDGSCGWGGGGECCSVATEFGEALVLIMFRTTATFSPRISMLCPVPSWAAGPTPRASLSSTCKFCWIAVYRQLVLSSCLWQEAISLLG